MEDDFRWAVEADREVAGSGTGGGIAAEGSDLPGSPEELRRDFGHGDQGAATGEADLASVGMAAEHQVGAGGGCLGGDLGAVAEEDPGQAGAGRSHGPGDVVGLEEVGIVDPGEQKAGSAFADDDRIVVEEIHPLADEAGPDGEGVVVAEDAVDPAGGTANRSEDPGHGNLARFLAVAGDVVKIAGEDRHFVAAFLDTGADYRHQGGVEIDMKVGELEDPEAIESGWPSGDPVAEAGQAEVKEIAVSVLVETGGLESPAEEAVRAARGGGCLAIGWPEGEPGGLDPGTLGDPAWVP